MIAGAFRQDASPISDAASWREFRDRLADHLDRFGHAIYDLDFAKSLAAEEPAPLLETLRFFLTGQARSPHERQATAAAAREQATEMILARLKGLRRRSVHAALAMGARLRSAPRRRTGGCGPGLAALAPDGARSRAAPGGGRLSGGG